MVIHAEIPGAGHTEAETDAKCSTPRFEAEVLGKWYSMDLACTSPRITSLAELKHNEFLKRKKERKDKENKRAIWG